MNRMPVLVGGFRFGMILQLSVGPVCLMVFQTARSAGFVQGLSMVAAVALVDAAYIGLAALGVSSFLHNPRVAGVVKVLGGLILIAFGADTLLGVSGHSILPAMSVAVSAEPRSAFVQGLVLTASNPLTIVFWGGALSARAMEKGMDGYGLSLFGLGCVAATLAFLTSVSLFGRLSGTFITPAVSDILNVLVGFIICGYGAKMLLGGRKA